MNPNPQLPSTKLRKYPRDATSANVYIKEKYEGLLTFREKSASNWNFGQLLSLGVLLASYPKPIPGDSNVLDDLRLKGQKAPTPNQGLTSALGVIKGRGNYFPDSVLHRILEHKQEDLSAFAFYSGLREILEPKTEYSARSLDEDELGRYLPPGGTADQWGYQDIVRTQGNQGGDSMYYPTTDPADTPMSSDMTDVEEKKNEMVKDELITTSIGIQFIKLVLALHLRQGIYFQHWNSKPFPAVTIAQETYKVKTRLGEYNAITDGGIFQTVFSDTKSYRLHDVPVADVEAKAHVTGLVAQHIAEIIGNIRQRMSVRYPHIPYDQLSSAKRTSYLLCFTQTDFFVVWATFTPEYPQWIFSKASSTNHSRSVASRGRQSKTKNVNQYIYYKDKESGEEICAPPQTFYVSPSYSLLKTSTRIEAA